MLERGREEADRFCGLNYGRKYIHTVRRFRRMRGRQDIDDLKHDNASHGEAHVEIRDESTPA